MIEKANLHEAYNGSFYTLSGVYENKIDEWIEKYEARLNEAHIGTPAKWYYATAEDVNKYFKLTPVRDDKYPAFPEREDFNLLMFPLDNLDIEKLSMFKIYNEDRWFDDIINNRLNFIGKAYNYLHGIVEDNEEE
jgi:hypothetical protein